MLQQTTLAGETVASAADSTLLRLEPGVQCTDVRSEADQLIRRMRRSAKRRKRTLAWLFPLVAVGMFSTVFVLSHIDYRLSLAIFGVSAAIVALGLVGEAGQWGRMADRAAELGDVRAIGPLLSVLNERDSSACDAIEEALISLLPRVVGLGQLSRSARSGLNRLLLEFEMPGLRGGHNTELARTALELVATFRDCSALPAVRRLADGFTATRPAASIRDLANDILPDLEIRAGLLRPALPQLADDRLSLRPAAGSPVSAGPAELIRPVTD